MIKYHFASWPLQKALAVTFIFFLLSYGISWILSSQWQFNPAYYSFPFTNAMTLLTDIGAFIGTMLLYFLIQGALDRARWSRTFTLQYAVATVFLVIFVIIWFTLWYVQLVGPQNVAISPSSQLIVGYLTNTSANLVQAFSPASHQVLYNIGGFNQPTYVSFNVNGTQAFVVNNGNSTTSIVDVRSHQLLQSITSTYGYAPFPPLILAYLILFFVTWFAAYLNETFFPGW